MSRHVLWVGTLVVCATTVVGAAAPGPPHNPVAVVSGHTISLTWQAPSTGGVPLGYLVEASLSPGGAAIAAFLVINPTIVFSTVPVGVYYLRVRAGNAEGISAPSTEIAVSVPADISCPSPPNAPRSLSASVIADLVTLTWLAPAGGCAATTYVVHAGSAAGLSDLAIFNVGASTSLVVSAPLGTYFVRIVALNAFGQSVASNEIVVTVSSTSVDLSGIWSGESDYINAPFEFRLRHSDRGLGGTYQDQKDFGGVAGQLTGIHVLLDVNFGDTGIRFEGTLETEDRIRGTIRVPVLGRTFTFVMTR